MISALLVAHPAAAARIAVGDLDTAAAFTDQLEADGAIRGLDVAMRVADLRGRLAAGSGDAEGAIAAYTHAVAAITPDCSILDVANVRLGFGRLLRTTGKRHRALEQLAQARTLLESVGAVAYIERVDAELAQAGLGKPRERRRSPLDLTDRERDVVTLAVRGLTTKQIAAELYVSAKAVEYHLGNLYGKLGISSRQELRERMATH
jgi:ATP/maltotriose-dependent transcriptional regulator MalT